MTIMTEFACFYIGNSNWLSSTILTTFDSQLIMIKYLLNKYSLKSFISAVYSINKHFYDAIGFIEIVSFYLLIYVNTANNLM